MHLRAYMVDRNPHHILDAVAVYCRLGVPLTPIMRKNALKAILEVKTWRPAGNPKKTTHRDLRILSDILGHYGADDIPRDLNRDLELRLMQRYSLPSISALRMVVTRWRQKIRNEG